MVRAGKGSWPAALHAQRRPWLLRLARGRVDDDDVACLHKTCCRRHAATANAGVSFPKRGDTVTVHYTGTLTVSGGWMAGVRGRAGLGLPARPG